MLVSKILKQDWFWIFMPVFNKKISKIFNCKLKAHQRNGKSLGKIWLFVMPNC
jgi:hypothetical protein